VEPVLLNEARIDPLPTVSTNLSLFLVPTIFPFTFKLPSLDNLRLEDMSELLAKSHGNNVAEWAQIMLNYNKHGENAITLYNHLEDSNLLTRHLGARAGDLYPHINSCQQAWTMSFSGLMYV